MHQLPSGRHVALTIDSLLEKAKNPNYNEYVSLKDKLATFENFSTVVRVAELRFKGGIPCKIKGAKLGYFCYDDLTIKLPDIPCKIEDAESDQVFCYTGLIVKAVGTNRSKLRMWSKSDIKAFKSWVLEEATHQWLRKAYDELLLAFSNAPKPDFPTDCYVDDDYVPPFNNGSAEEDLPDCVIKVIGELIKRDNVQSVSCPFNNSKAWRLLVEEQVRRSKLMDIPLQKALTLCGPDSGFSFDPADWGGYVHIPYEGACMGDLFVLPEWRNLFIEQANKKGERATLADYATYWVDPEHGNFCHYLLLKRDMGELSCAHRQVVGDGWFLYESNRPYVKTILSELAR